MKYCDMCSIPSICSERRKCRYADTPAKEPHSSGSERRLVRQLGDVWVASQDGMASIGATRKDALSGLADCIKCKTSLQIIHTWATFQGGRELVPKHVENLTTKTLAPFRLANAAGLGRRTLDSDSK